MAAAMVSLAEDWGLTQRLARGANHTAESLTCDAVLNRLDLSYREVCDTVETGNQQVTVVPAPRSLSA